ncbi:MAG: DNA adenine methylase [Anaerolineae bacterium]
MSRRSRSRAAGPFLKWAGGKHSLLDQYAPFFPPRAETYYEPFVGSGAVFFYLRGRDFARRYVLSDTNAELINVYAVVRDHLEELIVALAAHQQQHGREHYDAVRALDRAGLHRLDPVTRAARLIYLNHTCYNGLWRVNRKGHFNVPMGRYRRPRILDEARLRAASQALQGVDLHVRGFAGAAAEARPGDLVYFDPPYVPLSRTANFTSYAADDFGEDDQRALAETFRALAVRGCHVMLSNSDTPLVRELYAGFRIETIRAQRRINRDAARRGPIDEVLVLSVPG